ncbi:hypothetical protein D3C80_2195470 [compost metagenome]
MKYDAPEFDEALGLHGLHQVRPQVALQRRETILPPDLFEQYSKLSFWQDQANSRANVVTAKLHPAAAVPTAAP